MICTHTRSIGHVEWQERREPLALKTSLPVNSVESGLWILSSVVAYFHEKNIP